MSESTDKPKVTSSECPAYHLIPRIALDRLAKRFQTGIERKGDGAWNATSKNQECLTDRELLLDRINHAIKHAMILQQKVINDDWAGIVHDDDAAAIAWAGVFAISSIEAIRIEKYGEFGD